MTQNIIESFLEEKIGLDPAAMGRGVVEKAIRRRMDQCRLTHEDAYAKFLMDSNEEWNNLIETVVVPETWFFRNRKVFDYLVRFVKDYRPSKDRGQTLRLLSIPCSTGEEPFSIAMALMDAGIKKDRFHIDGVDISEDALKKAKLGVYGPGSFRGKDLTFRNRYFQPQNDGYQLFSHVREKVRLRVGNVLKNRFMAGGPYDVIFCRNLMIYMSPEARNRTLETMSRLLAETGILFCGHAERQAALDWGFDAVRESGVFACRKRCRKSNRQAPPVRSTRPTLKREIHKKKTTPTQKPMAPNDLLSTKAPGHQNQPKLAAFAPQPEQETHLFLKARAMADQGELPAALELCEVFLGDNPAHAEAHFLMGLIYEALHNEVKAEAFFNKAIYLNPDHFEALNHLAFIESHRGNKRGADRLRQRAQKIVGTRSIAPLPGGRNI